MQAIKVRRSGQRLEPIVQLAADPFLDQSPART
jgi:hypothetical protein